MLGCTATPYQELGDTGGYYHQRLHENIFKVGFRGNGFTNYKRAKDFAFLRVAEICDQLDFTYFVIEGQNDVSASTTIDTGSTSYTSGFLYGDSYSGTTYSSGSSMSFQKPGVELIASCFDNKPTGRYLEIFEAKLVIKQLKEKYHLKGRL